MSNSCSCSAALWGATGSVNGVVTLGPDTAPRGGCDGKSRLEGRLAVGGRAMEGEVGEAGGVLTAPGGGEHTGEVLLAYSGGEKWPLPLPGARRGVGVGNRVVPEHSARGCSR